MLYEQNEVTNMVMLKENLVAVKSGEFMGKQIVTIVKNNYNAVTGAVPISLYEQLVEEFETPKEAKETTEEELEVITLDDIYDLISTIGGGVKTTVQDSVNDEKLKNTFKEVSDVFEEMFSNKEEIKEKAKVYAEDVRDTAKLYKESLKVQLKISKLESIRDIAIDEEVATKGFIKKIQKRIDALNLLK